MALDGQTVKIANPRDPKEKKGHYLREASQIDSLIPAVQENRYHLYNKIYIFFKESCIWRKQKPMNDTGNLGLTTAIILIVFILIAAVAGSVIIQTTQNVSDQDLTSITNDALDEIITYIQIKNVVGKYENIQGQEGIYRIALLVKPLVSVHLDIEKMTIMISTGDDLRILPFSGQAASLKSCSLFGHPLWDTFDEGSFGVLSTVDDDNSMTDFHLINKNTDMGLIIIKLPATAPLHYDESLKLTLIPSPGNECSVTLEPPLPTTRVVTLYE